VKVSARRRKGYAHALTARHHTLIADEPKDKGGADTGPKPTELLALSLAACTAITIEMYANHKKWDLREVQVDVEYELDARESCSRFDVVLRLPEGLPNEQVEGLRRVAAKCPVHRTLEGQIEISDRVEPAPRAA
jgi:putative redox protein